MSFIFVIILALQGAFLFIVGLSTVERAASVFTAWPGIVRCLVTSPTVQNAVCINWPLLVNLKLSSLNVLEVGQDTILLFF